MAVMAGRQLGC